MQFSLERAPNNMSWWQRPRQYSDVELAWDGIVHGLGIVIALTGGCLLLLLAGSRTAPDQVPALGVYVGSLITVLAVSLAFNMASLDPLRRFLARLDQAAIFLLIAGTYTPMLALLAGSTAGMLMLTGVWSAALVGMALKLLVPERFGRIALLLYCAIGWSGLAIFNELAHALPPSTIWLLLAGGVAYSSGIVFHVWQRLQFHNVLWHCFVVLGASLHLWAVMDVMVLQRL